jgi:adenosylhomocysteine nucleosidase
VRAYVRVQARLKWLSFDPFPALSSVLADRCSRFLADELTALEARFGAHPPNVRRVLIVRAGRLVSSYVEVTVLCSASLNAHAVEMENAALARA